MRLFGEQLEVPVHPLREAAAQFIDGLQGDDALNRTAQAGFVLVDGVAAQHPEDGDVNGPFSCLGGHVGVLAAGIVSSVPVPAPQGVTVCAHLVSAVAGCLDAVFVLQIGEGSGLDEPGADGLGIHPEDFLEFFHVNVHQMLSFCLGVSDGEPDMGVPVPREAPSPGVARGLYMRLGDFPPGAHFAAPLDFLLHQSLVRRVDKGVILKEISAHQVLAPKILRLGADGLKQHLFGDFVASRLGIADEVDDIDDARTLCRFLDLGSAGRYQQQGQEEQSFHMHVFFLYKISEIISIFVQTR